jgi:Tfp pilus assembly protein PilF
LLTELGIHYLSVGQDRLGEQSLLQAIRFNPSYQPAHASLAELYERAGMPEKAERHRTLTKRGRPRDGKTNVLSQPP